MRGQRTGYKCLANMCLELRPKTSETVSSVYKWRKTTGNWSPFLQPSAGHHYEHRPVYRVVCPFTPQISLVLINWPGRDGTLSWRWYAAAAGHGGWDLKQWTRDRKSDTMYHIATSVPVTVHSTENTHRLTQRKRKGERQMPTYSPYVNQSINQKLIRRP